MSRREEYMKTMHDYENEINPLLNVELNGIKGTISLHEVRYIGDGSGDIHFENGQTVRFYLDKGLIHSEEYIQSLFPRLERVIALSHEKNQLLNEILFS